MTFNTINTIEELCDFLGVTPAIFSSTLRSRDRTVIPYALKKNSGGYRTIYVVKDDTLKRIHRTLKTCIEQGVEFGEEVQGFVRGRSIKTNAKQHLSRKYVLRADIRSFYESITLAQVKHLFVQLGFKEHIADVLADLVTMDGSLATGFSASPLLSNIIAAKVDVAMQEIANHYQATYTRYGDDLTFSGNGDVPQLTEIEAALSRCGFEMNKAKYKVQMKGGAQYVTGLSVNDHVRPHLPRKLKRSLRLEVYYIQKYGVEGHFMHHLEKGTYPKVIYDGSFVSDRIAGWCHLSLHIDPNFGRALVGILKRRLP